METPREPSDMRGRVRAHLLANPDRVAELIRRMNEARLGENITDTSSCGGVKVHDEVLAESDVAFGAWMDRDEPSE